MKIMNRIHRLLFPLLLLLSPLAAMAQTPGPLQGFCSVGGVKVSTSGMSSSTTVQGSYPNCTVTVYLTGTSTLAPIFTNGGSTPLSNPFTANANASWLFYAATGVGLDVTMSGGTPIPLPAPYTISGVFAGAVGSGGGGGAGNPAAPAFAVQLANSAVNAFQADPNITINPTAHVLATPTLAAANPMLALNTPATLTSTQDYTVFTPGVVGGVLITNGGTYTAGTIPSVTFSSPPTGGTTATGLAVMTSAGTAVASITMTNLGLGYVTAPTVTFSGATPAIGTATVGKYANQPFPLARPWQLVQTVNRRFGPAQGENPMSVTLNMMSGTDNTGVVQGTYGGIALTSNAMAPQQGGGLFAINSNSYAVGDNVGQTMVLNGRGVSRGGDEGTEYPRFFLAPINDVAGGHLAAVATDAQGNNPISVTQIPNVYSFNFYEKSFIMDVTAKNIHTGGNIASIGTYAPDTRFSYFQGDAGSNITSTFGVSTQTTFTTGSSTVLAVDNFVYTGACGSQVRTAQQYPISGPSAGANDGFMTNYQGVGVAGENTNYNSAGALVGFCATVGSTAGMVGQTGTPGQPGYVPGTLLFIADADYQVEFTRVISVVDGTHFTAFMHQPHFGGATVNFGGAVGNCIGADADITPIGTNSTSNNPQVAIQRLCYPIVQSLAGDLVTVYTNTQGSDVNNLRSLLPSANTPKVPLTITAPVVTGGVLTSFTANDVIGNANNYVANNTVSVANSGHPNVLPAPTVTANGCTVAPVITMNTVNANSGVTYAPVIASGGSGCGTVTFNIPTFLPTPFGIYPLAMVYKSEDPNLPAGTTFSNGVLTDGKPVFMPFNTSAWTIGDEIMAPDFWNGMGVSGQYNYNSNFLHAIDGRNGPTTEYRYSGVGNGFAFQDFQNLEPTAHYFGSFANNYTKTLLTDYIVPPPVAWQMDGQHSVGISLSFPPLTVASGQISGGSVITVNCANFQLPANVDPPCKHNMYSKYNIFQQVLGGTSINMNLFADPVKGVIGVGSAAKTFQAPTLTAYDPVQATTDTVLAGIVNPGPNRGACIGFDLLLTTTGNPFGSRDAHICGFGDNAGGGAGDLAFELNSGGGAPLPTLRVLTMTPTLATFTTPIASTVATGTAPLTIASTTLVSNLNVGTVDGVTITGVPAVGQVPTAISATQATWQTPTTTGFTGNYNITTPTGTCGFSYTDGRLMTKTGSC